MSEERALQLGYKPKAYLRTWTYSGVDPFEGTYCTTALLRHCLVTMHCLTLTMVLSCAMTRCTATTFKCIAAWRWIGCWCLNSISRHFSDPHH